MDWMPGIQLKTKVKALKGCRVNLCQLRIVPPGRLPGIQDDGKIL
jgi:hypothetical protein